MKYKNIPSEFSQLIPLIQSIKTNNRIYRNRNNNSSFKPPGFTFLSNIYPQTHLSPIFFTHCMTVKDISDVVCFTSIKYPATAYFSFPLMASRCLIICILTGLPTYCKPSHFWSSLFSPSKWVTLFVNLLYFWENVHLIRFPSAQTRDNVVVWCQ